MLPPRAMHAVEVPPAPAQAEGHRGDGIVQRTRATVLVVDDDVVVCQTLSEDLAAAAYETLIAHSGEECLRLLASSEVDLVLLDLRMPGLSGLDVLAQLSSRTGTRYLPVIVLSALENDATDALLAGASDYVTKPWQREELLARVRLHLRLRQREAQLEAAVARLDERTQQLEGEMAERKRAEAQLVMANRMSAIGVVAAGVAHEINNPLTYVIGNLELLARKLPATEQDTKAPEPALRPLVSHALEGAERVRLIVHDLKSFSRPDSDVVEPVDLADVLDSVLRLAGHELRHSARVVRDYGDLPKVAGSASRLSQVFLNVVTNAAQAMAAGSPERDVLHVRMRALDISPFVEVEISDTGVGLEASSLLRAFDPFYTTKAASAGTGLGLALSRKIVEAFGGSIELASTLGKGSVVRIRLRVYSEAEGAHEATGPGQTLRAAKRLKRVLVVDDEAAIGTTLKAMLEDDYEVDLARSGEEALTKLKLGASYDVVLCDLMMEGLSGMELYELAREHYALGERFVFMTGGACTARARAFVAAQKDRVLEKPFTTDELENALRARLARAYVHQRAERTG